MWLKSLGGDEEDADLVTGGFGVGGFVVGEGEDAVDLVFDVLPANSELWG